MYVGNLFDQTMAVNGEAFAAGHYEAAYHALMAALHLAQDLGDETRLRNVSQVAGQQRQTIDSLVPAHRLCSQEARSRGHESVFALAERQAAVQATLAHASNRPDRGVAGRPDEGLEVRASPHPER